MSMQAVDLVYSNPIKIDKYGRRLDVRCYSPNPGELKALYSIIETHRPERTLEIGMALGGSTIVLATAKRDFGLKTPHVVLDPFQDDFGDLGLTEIHNAGLQVEHIPLLSEDYLIKTCEKYDFIFIDGNHDIGHVVNDAFWGDKILNEGGIIALHDGLLMSAFSAVTYLVKHRGYRIVPLTRDSVIWTCLRMLRYFRFGYWYVSQVIPRMHSSLVALQKRQPD